MNGEIQSAATVPPILNRRLDKSSLLGYLALGIATVVGVIVLFMFNPTEHGFFPRCALYAWTGIACPGCGILRGLHHLTHGHFLEAFQHNTLFMLLIPIAVYSYFRVVLKLTGRDWLPPIFAGARWMKVFLTILIVFTVARNIPVQPFSFFYPKKPPVKTAPLLQ